MHARCGYTGASNRTAFVDLNDVSRKLKPPTKQPVQFVSTRFMQKQNLNMLSFFLLLLDCSVKLTCWKLYNYDNIQTIFQF